MGHRIGHRIAVRIAFFSLLALFFPVFSYAQSCATATVTGTVTDPNGLPYSNGVIEASISSGSPLLTCGGVPFANGYQRVSLSAAGTFSMQLALNSGAGSIQPSGTQWTFRVSGTAGLPLPVGTGTQVFSYTASISGNTDLSAALSALAPKLTNGTGGGGGSGPFSSITSGTNTSAAMVVGTGASLSFSGSGTIAATTAAALATAGTDCSTVNFARGVDASGNAICAQPSNVTGNAATATALASTPTQCGAGQGATGIAANGNANCSPDATSVSNSDGTLTISPTTGAVVASLALAHANTWTAQQTFSAIVDSGIAAGTSPICPNGIGGAFTTSGCALASSIPFQQGGSPIGNATTINCTTNVTCTNSLGVVSVAASGTGSGVPTPGAAGIVTCLNAGCTSTNIGSAQDIGAPLICHDSSGSLTAKACTLPTLTTPTQGMVILFDSTTSTSAGWTLTVNGQTNAVLSQGGATGNTDGDIVANNRYLMTYEFGTTGAWVLVGSAKTVMYGGGTTNPIADNIACLAGSVAPEVINCTNAFQTNGGINSSQLGLNFQTSTTNAAGLIVTPFTPSGINEMFEVSGTVNPSHGGTGSTSPMLHAVAIGEGGSPFAFVGPGKTGQVLTFNNAADPTANSPGVSDGNGGAAVTTTPYPIQCDSSTALLDRGTVIRIRSGASIVNVPLSSGSGCANLPVSLIDDGAGSITVQRNAGSTDTFTIADGVAITDGATTFSMTNGMHATLTQGATGIWEVRLADGAAQTINGGAMPQNAAILGSNGSGQPIAVALPSADIFVGNGSNLPAAVAMSQDCTISNAGAMTCTKLQGGTITVPAAAGSATMAQVISSGTSALPTSAIASAACSLVTTAATGVATTDTIKFNPNVDPTGVTGYAPSASGSLYIWPYPTAGNVNFKVCNNTSAPITPSALTLNWQVTR